MKLIDRVSAAVNVLIHGVEAFSVESLCVEHFRATVITVDVVAGDRLVLMTDRMLPTSARDALAFEFEEVIKNGKPLWILDGGLCCAVVRWKGGK